MFLWNEKDQILNIKLEGFIFYVMIFFSLAESNELHKQVKNGLLAGHKWQETQVVIKRASF